MDDPGYLGKFWVGGHDHYRFFFLRLAYILGNNKDIDTKLSGYDPCGISSTSNKKKLGKFVLLYYTL